jgi:adenine phosphoribosyltransferase
MTATDTIDKIRKSIREVPDFPKPGILFYDITTLLADPDALRSTVDVFAEQFDNQDVSCVVGMESRGFLFGAPLAIRLGVGFVPVRKPGKLPCEVETASYELEYGTDSLEIHRDAIEPGQRVLIIDDLLATGGTARATVDLVRRLGAEVVGCGFVVELAGLQGRDKLEDVHVFSVLGYE